MIQQALRVEIVPVPGTESLYSAAVYSVGLEDNQEVVQRHMFTVALGGNLEKIAPGQFGTWCEVAMQETYRAVWRKLLDDDVETVSAAYAHAEDEQDKASHRM